MLSFLTCYWIIVLIFGRIFIIIVKLADVFCTRVDQFSSLVYPCCAFHQTKNCNENSYVNLGTAKDHAPFLNAKSRLFLISHMRYIINVCSKTNKIYFHQMHFRGFSCPKTFASGVCPGLTPLQEVRFWSWLSASNCNFLQFQSRHISYIGQWY